MQLLAANDLLPILTKCNRLHLKKTITCKHLDSIYDPSLPVSTPTAHNTDFINPILQPIIRCCGRRYHLLFQPCRSGQQWQLRTLGKRISSTLSAGAGKN